MPPIQSQTVKPQIHDTHKPHWFDGTWMCSVCTACACCDGAALREECLDA